MSNEIYILIYDVLAQLEKETHTMVSLRAGNKSLTFDFRWFDGKVNQILITFLVAEIDSMNADLFQLVLDRFNAKKAGQA